MSGKTFEDLGLRAGQYVRCVSSLDYPDLVGGVWKLRAPRNYTDRVCAYIGEFCYTYGDDGEWEVVTYGPWQLYNGESLPKSARRAWDEESEQLVAFCVVCDV